MSKLVLVTGGAGFVGSNLCKRLIKDGNRVVSLDNYFSGTREAHVPGVDYREGHTKDIEQLIPEKPDLVYHLGEYSRVEKSFEDIEAVWDLNKTGTFAVLEFVRQRGCRLVYAGSSTKFADQGLGKMQSPYAWTKATNTELVKLYGEWFDIDYAITYFYNVYGPGERSGSYGTLIEIFKQSYLEGRPLTVTSPGTQERNFTHVDDIVAGLILVGEKGKGDEYGIGDDTSYSILDVARMYGSEIVMMPERAGNRMNATLETRKTRELGWSTTTKLPDYIDLVKKEEARSPREKRILVFTTTFHPIEGPAERALLDLARTLPSIHFDIITAAHSKDTFESASPSENITIHRIGIGHKYDKFLLPILGRKKAFELASKNDYLFSWSLMASYGALPALSLRRGRLIPLLITLADQQLSWYERIFLRTILSSSDQVYATLPDQGGKLGSLSTRMSARRSLGEGDGFANQIRFAYSTILRGYLTK
jgi:UDP-glucose 4-epimerase